jgi:hypothetical protein
VERKRDIYEIFRYRGNLRQYERERERTPRLYWNASGSGRQCPETLDLVGTVHIFTDVLYTVTHSVFSSIVTAPIYMMVHWSIKRTGSDRARLQ